MPRVARYDHGFDVPADLAVTAAVRFDDATQTDAVAAEADPAGQRREWRATFADLGPADSGTVRWFVDGEYQASGDLPAAVSAASVVVTPAGAGTPIMGTLHLGLVTLHHRSTYPADAPATLAKLAGWVGDPPASIEARIARKLLHDLDLEDPKRLILAASGEVVDGSLIVKATITAEDTDQLAYEDFARPDVRERTHWLELWRPVTGGEEVFAEGPVQLQPSIPPIE